MSRVQKYSLTVAGHATSLSLEPEFWGALKTCAIHKQTSVPDLVGEIDRKRLQGKPPHANLSSAIRVYILGFYQQQKSPA